MKTIPLLLLTLALGVACSKQASIYSQAPSDLMDEAKPIFLANKFLKDGNEYGFKEVLAKDSLQKYLKERSLDLGYFNKLRAKHFNEPEVRYFTVEAWKKFRGEEDPLILEMKTKLKTNETIVVCYTERNNSKGHGSAIVVFENGVWKATGHFNPLK